MRIIFISTISLLLLTTEASAQVRSISGKVIDENLSPIPQVQIRSSDSTILGTTDLRGQFEIAIPIENKSLLINWIGFEWASIQLEDSCNQVEIILMYNVIYDYTSLKKINKL